MLQKAGRRAFVPLDPTLTTMTNGPSIMASSRICSIDACDKPTIARGWCGNHYYRWNTHGDPLGGGTSKGDAMRFITEIALPYTGDDCLIWPYSRDVAGRAKININGSQKVVARYVCEKVNGPPPTPKHVAAHECGNGHLGCIAPLHVSWKTHIENKGDEIRHGTRYMKLSNLDVEKIRSLQGVIIQRDIAKMFGVSLECISKIIRNLSRA